ncbi:MAG: transposase [Tannerellaceae bacterium]|nr:transposase [Tannerellaceae bacterium]
MGALLIKYICNLDNRETVEQISENVHMQYFLDYSSFTSDKPFDASLFIDIRKQLGLEIINIELCFHASEAVCHLNQVEISFS